MDDHRARNAYEDLIELRHQPDWLLVTVRPSRFSWPLGRTILRSARRALKAGSVRAVLVDLREVSGPISTTQRFLMGAYGAALRFPGPIAMVGNAGIVDSERFGILVAKSRGTHTSVFTDLEDAQRWLARETPAS